jgi:hypothetical protein
MALINCPECKNQISDLAESCPNCGYPLIQEIVSNLDEKNIQEQDIIEIEKSKAREKKDFQDSFDDFAARRNFSNSSGRKIMETKCTCNMCGNIWFYGKDEVNNANSDALYNFGKAMTTCCSGCFPLIFLPDKKVIDLNKCPRCGSLSITKNNIIHYV